MILSVQNLSKTYLDSNGVKRVVLEDVNFEVAINESENKIVSLLAPLGAGKTTLFKSIAGLINHEGIVTLEEKVVTESNGEIIYIPENCFAYPWLDVKENIELAHNLKLKNDGDVIYPIKEIIELVGLTGYENYFTSLKKSGFNVRVAIGRALKVNPKFILLDDVFKNLDGETRLELVDTFKKMTASTKAAFLVATTNISDAILISQTIILMRKNPGKIIKEIKVPSLDKDKDSEIITKIKNEIEMELKSQNMLNSVLISL